MSATPDHARDLRVARATVQAWENGYMRACIEFWSALAALGQVRDELAEAKARLAVLEESTPPPDPLASLPGALSSPLPPEGVVRGVVELFDQGREP